jgi:anaerobic ribonucleoside-triphosphate reductase activating protein
MGDNELPQLHIQSASETAQYAPPDSTMLRIAGIVEDSIVDGPGLRLAVFTQGCIHNCPGCHNPHTHSLDGGYLHPISEILDRLRRNPLLDGLTLTGGDPFMQPEASAQLAQEAHGMGFSVVTYTGYLYEQILENPRFLPLLYASDILIDGPFIQEQRTLSLAFRGSRNQRVILVPESLKAGRVIEDAQYVE